jgi:curved DNA-binding protein CbpA
MPREPDHYAVLDIPRSASSAEIKRRYRLLMREAHPDANAGDPAATRRAARINLAFEVLGNAARRREYDARNPATNGNGARKRSDRTYAYWAEHEDWEDIVAEHVKPPRPAHVHSEKPRVEPEEIEVDLGEFDGGATRVKRRIRITNRCDCTMKGDVSTSEPWLWGPIGTFELGPRATVEFDVQVIGRKVKFPGLSRVTFVSQNWACDVPVKITGFKAKRRRVLPATDAQYVRQARRKPVRR